MCIVFFSRCVEVVWEVCFIVGSNVTGHLFLVVCDFSAVDDGCGSMRIICVLFEISCVF